MAYMRDALVESGFIVDVTEDAERSRAWLQGIKRTSGLAMRGLKPGLIFNNIVQ